MTGDKSDIMGGDILALLPSAIKSALPFAAHGLPFSFLGREPADRMRRSSIL